ncbi:hypothetical protein BGZ99_002098, partial [Dissophora globulifera]
MKYQGPSAFASLAFLLTVITTAAVAAASTNETFAYIAKGDRLVPVSNPLSNEFRKWHGPHFGNSTERAPHNSGPGECLSDYEYDYSLETTSLFWGINNEKRNIYTKLSKTVVCYEGGCDLTATDTLASATGWKIAGDVNFDVQAVKVKVASEYSVQTTAVRTTSYKISIRSSRTGYLGFAQSWAQASGNKKTVLLTCCRFGRCTRGNPKYNFYNAFLPRTLRGSTESVI